MIIRILFSLYFRVISGEVVILLKEVVSVWFYFQMVNLCLKLCVQDTV